MDVSVETAKSLGLTADEFDKIQQILGRMPNFTELSIFSVMWSEHCSYKNTRPLLKTFPTKSPKILVGAGDGDGMAHQASPPTRMRGSMAA